MTEPHAFTYAGRGYKMRSLAAGDYFDRWYPKHGTFYELPLLEAIRARSLGGIYIDVGSNIGNHTVYWATQCRPARIYAVEPHECFRTVFNANLLANRLAGSPIEVCPVAVSDVDGVVTMSPPAESNARVTGDGVGDTECHTIDTLFAHLRNVTVLKLDIEGYEAKAIEGAAAFLKHNKPLIVAELQDSARREAFRSLVAPLGYTTDGKNYAKTPTYIWECAK